MALDFLGALGGAIGGIGGAASAISGLFGSKKAKLPPEVAEAQRIQSSMLRGLTGGNSPEFNNMVQAEASNARSALLKAVNEIVRQNRRAMTRGPAGVLVNPDRRDESIARALMGVYENEDDRAKAKAKQTAMRILGDAGGVANTAMGLNQQGMQNTRDRQVGRAQGFQALGSAISRGGSDLNQLFSSLGAGAPSTTINSAFNRRGTPQGLY